MSKRKRVVLSIKDKCDILNKLDQGESMSKLSREYNVGKSTMSDIKKQRASILSFLTDMDPSGSSDRKTMKQSENVVVDKAVYRWYCEMKSQGIPVSGPDICAKALYFNKKLNGGPNFKASPGWLMRFKSRHGIQKSTNSSETNEHISTTFINKFKEILLKGNFNEENVYNADHIDFLWNSRASEANIESSEKENKDYVRALMCVNASGNHRMPVFLTADSKEPAYSTENKSATAVYVDPNSISADFTFLLKWFEEIFVPAVREKCSKKEKVLLLLGDIATGHLCEVLNRKDNAIAVLFIPHKNMKNLQPIDQGIKNNFLDFYVNDSINCQELHSSSSNCNNMNVTLLCNAAGTAWSKVSSQTIKRSWINLWPDITHFSKDVKEEISDDFDECQPDEPEFVDTCKTEINNVWMQTLTNNDQEFDISGPSNGFCSNFTSVDNNIPENIPPTNAEAYAALETALKWYEAQEDCQQYELEVLRAVKDLSARKCSKQEPITGWP